MTTEGILDVDYMLWEMYVTTGLLETVGCVGSISDVDELALSL